MFRKKQKPGGPILRHEYRKRPELARGDEALMRALDAHVEEHFGPVDRVWHELVSMHVHVDVLVVAPTPERPVSVLVTCGMSQRPMPGRDGPLWAELMMMVPEGFPLFDDTFERAGWPLTMLQGLAHIPHDFDTLLWWGHTVPNDDPAVPYADSTEMCCALIGERLLKPEGFDTLNYDGHDVAFLAVYPLLPAEVDCKLEQGAQALFERLEDGGVTEVLRETRASVV